MGFKKATLSLLKHKEKNLVIFLWSREESNKCLMPLRARKWHPHSEYHVCHTNADEA